MTADLRVVPDLPGARVVPLHPSDGGRLRCLRWLAPRAGDMSPEDVADRLSAWAGPHLSGEALTAAWEGYRGMAERAEDVRSGLITPAEICDELTCPDRHGAACEIAEQDEEDALSVLAGTTTGRLA